MTREPAAENRAAQAAPMPEAAPVTAMIRSGSLARLEDLERLVGVGTHGELGVDHVEQRAVGVDDEGDALVGQEVRAPLRPELGGHGAVGVGEEGVAEDSFSSNCFCLSTESALMPIRWAPTAANSAPRSRKWQLSLVQP